MEALHEVCERHGPSGSKPFREPEAKSGLAGQKIVTKLLVGHSKWRVFHHKTKESAKIDKVIMGPS